MSIRPENIPDHLTSLRKRSGLSLEQLAKRMGYAGASSIQRYFALGGRSPGYLPRDTVAKFADALVGIGTPPINKEDVWELAGPELAQALGAPNATITGPVDTLSERLPVYGSAVGGVDGEFVMNGSALYDVMSPPSLIGVRGAYAVQISGDSMEPRYFDGEVVFVDPNRRPTKGDFIIAQIQVDEHGPPWAYAKRLIRHNSVELVVEQYNPAKQMVFPGDRVVSVHFIVMGGVV